MNKFINREKYADRVWQNQYNSYSWQAQIEQLNILLSGDTLNFMNGMYSLANGSSKKIVFFGNNS